MGGAALGVWRGYKVVRIYVVDHCVEPELNMGKFTI